MVDTKTYTYVLHTMTPHFKFGTAVVSTLKEFDGESSTESSSPGSSSSSENETNNGAVVQHFGRGESSNDLLIVSLLEHLCSLYVSDHGHRNQLFTLLYERLKKMKLICPVAGLDELASIRGQYKVGFMKLVRAALATFDKDSHVSMTVDSMTVDGQETVQMLLKPWQVPTALPKHISLQTSRCDDDFTELCILGTGGYGEVHQVINKFDDCDYAIKKIYFRDKNPFIWIKILREAKHLAGLSHKNIVRYYASWLEYINSYPASATEQFHPCYLPALEAQAASAICDELESSSPNVSFEPSVSPGNSNHGACSGNHGACSGNHGACSGNHGACSGNHGDCSGNHGDSSYCLDDDSLGDSVGSSAGRCQMMKNACVVLHIQMELCTQTLCHWLEERNTRIFSPSTQKDVYSMVDQEINARILRQILKAVNYIHGQNIIHRDIKPKNIFLVIGDGDKIGAGDKIGDRDKTADGDKIGDGDKVQVKIGDFGLSRLVGTDVPLTPAPGRQAAATGDCYTSGVGTTSYAAPEQLSGCSYSSKSDLYSVGLIMYELYQPFYTEMEKCGSLRQIRDKQVLSQEFIEAWPVQAKCVQSLTGPADDRPTAAQTLQESFLCSKDQIIASLRSTVTSQEDHINLLQERISQLEQLLAEKDNQ